MLEELEGEGLQKGNVMSSDSEMSSISEASNSGEASDSEVSRISEASNSAEEENIIENEGGDVEVVFSQITPYEDEPLAEVDDDRETVEENQEVDEDGLTLAVLEARYEREITINSWFV